MHNLRRKVNPTRSCGCITVEANRIRPFEAIYNRLVRSAVKHGPYITYEEFLVFTLEKECHYCGALIQWIKHFGTVRHVSRYNIDRKDNSLGYITGNLVVCCKRCNFTKGDRFTYDEFVKLGAVIRLFKCSA